MSEPIEGTQLPAAVERLATRVVELRDTHNQLDAAVGDGDLGISTSKGVTGVRACTDANRPGDDLGKHITGQGMAHNRARPSTLGAFVATALMGALKEA